MATEYRLDRTQLKVVSFKQAEEDDRQFWWAKTPEERLQAMEFMRQVAFGPDAATARLQRVFEIVERKTG